MVLRSKRVILHLLKSGTRVPCSPNTYFLNVAFIEILNEELSSYALTLAGAVMESEEAFPEIKGETGKSDRA